MARPIKDNADYFSHDTDMRNDDRIKAVRRKFKHLGYAIYNMFLEYLTDKNSFQCAYNNLAFELMAGDFDEDPEQIKAIIDYCIELDLLQLKDGAIRCKTLEARLAPVVEKRNKAKEQVKDQPRVNGRFSRNNTDEPDISATETPQSKVKESKGYIVIGEPKEKYIIVKAKYAGEKHKRVFDLEKFFEGTGQLDGLKFKGSVHFDAFMDKHTAKIFNDDSHLDNAFRGFCESYQPPARAPDKFETAAYNKTLWTTAAWEEAYKKQLATNEEFRKYFGYNGKLQPSDSVGSKPKN